MEIMTVRLHGVADNSPLEMISGARLAYLHRVEAAAKDLVAALSSPAEAGEFCPEQRCSGAAPSR